MTKLEVCAVKFRNKLNKVFPSSKKDWFVSAIVTAAGSGTRMGGVSKQLMPLNGIPCIIYSLSEFQKCDEVKEIIVTAKAEEVSELKRLAAEYRITKLKDVVVGGSTRQESVSFGFLKIARESDIVAIHDAARPLIQAQEIKVLIDSCKRYGASSAAKPMVDSVKRVDQNGNVLTTVDREDLFTVQTPQLFKSDLYRASLALAKKSGATVTDDTALAELAGFSVHLCNVSPCNLKLTTQEDVQLISLILKERRNGQI